MGVHHAVKELFLHRIVALGTAESASTGKNHLCMAVAVAEVCLDQPQLLLPRRLICKTK